MDLLHRPAQMQPEIRVLVHQCHCGKKVVYNRLRLVPNNWWVIPGGQKVQTTVQRHNKQLLSLTWNATEQQRWPEDNEIVSLEY